MHQNKRRIDLSKRVPKKLSYNEIAVLKQVRVLKLNGLTSHLNPVNNEEGD